eukprot:Clim_evm13s142 gene=Clim_evmTU13s142
MVVQEIQKPEEDGKDTKIGFIGAKEAKGLVTDLGKYKNRLDLDKSVSIKAVIFDIEGTTTSISFVHDGLFPYVRERLEQYLKDNWESDDMKKIVQDLAKLREAEAKDFDSVPALSAEDPDQKSVKAYVLWLMDADRKVGPLKTLQGHMWKDGYEDGSLKGHLYEDSYQCLQDLHKAEVPIYIYSSGSVKAQKLLYGYSQYGDLLPMIKGHYDTGVGMKKEAQSYTKILKDLGLEEQPRTAVFVTDVLAEVLAAEEAGMQVVVSIRKGNGIIADDELAKRPNVVTDLYDLAAAVQGAGKARKAENVDCTVERSVDQDTNKRLKTD